MATTTETSGPRRAGGGRRSLRLDDTLEAAGIHVAAEVRDGTLYLSGEVDSEANRQAALDVGAAVAAARGLRSTTRST